MDTIHSFADVNQLGKRKLNKLCLDIGISRDFPKNVKINALCHCLNISTTGKSSVCELTARTKLFLSSSKLTDFKQLTPRYLYGLDGWMRDMSSVPTLDDSIVKQYLVDCSVIDDAALRSYKLTRPFQLKSCVHTLRFNVLPQSSFCVIRALCNPSQSCSEDDVKLVHIIVDKESCEPCGAYCTCTVGQVFDHTISTSYLSCFVC